jgi:hypothetical protein
MLNLGLSYRDPFPQFWWDLRQLHRINANVNLQSRQNKTKQNKTKQNKTKPPQTMNPRTPSPFKMKESSV